MDFVSWGITNIDSVKFQVKNTKSICLDFAVGQIDWKQIVSYKSLDLRFFKCSIYIDLPCNAVTQSHEHRVSRLLCLVMGPFSKTMAWCSVQLKHGTDWIHHEL